MLLRQSVAGLALVLTFPYALCDNQLSVGDNEAKPAVPVLERRQILLTTLRVCHPGEDCSFPTSTTHGTSSPPITTTTALSTTTTTKTASNSKDHAITGLPPATYDYKGYNLDLQTIFTQPPDCTTGGLTRVPGLEENVFLYNVINVVPETTMTRCFPSQFWSSAQATISLPPFKQLICPLDWESYPLESSYIICCPSGFQLHATGDKTALQPRSKAICWSTLAVGEIYDLTVYNSASLVSSTLGTALGGDKGALIYATAFDGFAATVTAVADDSTASKTDAERATKTGDNNSTNASSYTSTKAGADKKSMSPTRLKAYVELICIAQLSILLIF